MKLLFGRKRKKDNVPPPAGGRSVIAAGARVDGTLSGNVDLRIDGAVTGEVRGRTITVNPRAEVEATLKAWAIDVAGAMRGRIEALTVNVARTAVIDATIIHHRLSIEDGAVVKGLKPWHPMAEMTRRCENMNGAK